MTVTRSLLVTTGHTLSLLVSPGHPMLHGLMFFLPGHSWSQLDTPGHKWSQMVTTGHFWSHLGIPCNLVTYPHLVTAGHNLTSHVAWSHVLTWSLLVTPGHKLPGLPPSTLLVTPGHSMCPGHIFYLVTTGHTLASHVTWSHILIWSQLVTI